MPDTPSGQTPSQPNSGVSASQAASSAKQSTSQCKRKRVTEDVSISGGCEEAADAGDQDAATVGEDPGLPPKKPKGRRVSATTRMAQQGKDWDSFQLLCKTLKSRDGIVDERELTSMWEQLDNCLRTLGLRGETHWYLRCKNGEQHSTIRSFVTEWKASKERKPWPDTSHERGKQAIRATSQHTTSPTHHDSGATSSGHTHSKEPPPGGSTGHAPTSHKTQASVGTGKRGSSAALAGTLASPARSDPQQGSSAARSGASVTRLPAHSGPSSAPRLAAPELASGSEEPFQASAEASHFPEPRARPRPTGMTKSAAEVHKGSPGKKVVVPQQGERKNDGLLGLVPKTNTMSAGDVTYIEVTNQAMLERTTIGGGSISKPALEQAPKSTPNRELPPGAVFVPVKLLTGPAGMSQLDALREAYAMSSSSSEQSPKSAGPAVASAEEAQTEAEAAAVPTPLDPISVDPSIVETPNAGPTSIDTAGPDPSADPQSADPNSVDPPGADPSVVSRTHVDLTTSDPSGAKPISSDPSGDEPKIADPPTAYPNHADPNSADYIIDPASADTDSVACTNVDITRATPPGTISMGVDPTGVDPISVDPISVDPSRADPTSVDPTSSSDPTRAGPTSSADPSRAEPTGVGLSSVDLPGDEPTRADPTVAAPSSTKGKDTAALLEATQHVATAVAVSAIEDATKATETPDWKAMYTRAMQQEANRLGLFTHQDAALKARKRLEFQDDRLKTRQLVHDKLVDIQDDPVCDYVRLSLDTLAMVKKQTQQQVADHIQAVSHASEQLEKFHCTVVDILKVMPLPKMS